LNSIETDNDNDEKDSRDHLGDPDGSMCLTGRVQRSENRPGRLSNASTPGVFPIIAQHEIDTCSDAYARRG
jgi:hypothetical protein